MSCFPLIPAFSLPVPDNYYEELLFKQVLKDKIITEDSFDKLDHICKNFKITAVFDTKGTCSFKIDRKLNKVVISDEKKKQLRIDFSNNLMLSDAQLIVDYE